jgi:inorganic triphosphatase YgiF
MKHGNAKGRSRGNRRVGDEAKPQWLQTLKTAGRADSALSQRGERETPVPDAHLSLKALRKTPWADMDGDGTIFRALSPVFETNFERTVWLVRRLDKKRSVVCVTAMTAFNTARSSSVSSKCHLAPLN